MFRQFALDKLTYHVGQKVLWTVIQEIHNFTSVALLPSKDLAQSCKQTSSPMGSFTLCSSSLVITQSPHVPYCFASYPRSAGSCMQGVLANCGFLLPLGSFLLTKLRFEASQRFVALYVICQASYGNRRPILEVSSTYTYSGVALWMCTCLSWGSWRMRKGDTYFISIPTTWHPSLWLWPWHLLLMCSSCLLICSDAD